MDMRHTHYPQGLLMSSPGGLDYLKMPMQAMQLGPNGELIPTGMQSHHHGPSSSGGGGGGGNIALMEPLSVPGSSASSGAVYPPRPHHHHHLNPSAHPQTQSQPPARTHPRKDPNPKEYRQKKNSSTHHIMEVKQNRSEKDYLSTSCQTMPTAESSTLNLTDLQDTPLRQDKATEVDFYPKAVRSGEVLDMTPAHAPGLAQPQLIVVPTAAQSANGSLKLRDPTPHFCNICDKDFHSDFNLKRHMRDFHSDGGTPGASATLFNCQICKKNFQNRFNLRRHQSVVHGADGDTHYCDICCTDMHYKDNLRRHMKDVHHQVFPPHSPVSPERPKSDLALVPTRVFTCELCNKDLQNNYNLKRHRQAVHKETKILYGCDECDKDFTTIASYKRHKNMVHGSGKDAFHCDQCNRNFASKDGLKRHILAIHEHFEGDYECEICSKKFLRKENCVKHRKTHDSPYAMVADYELTTVTTSTLL